MNHSFCINCGRHHEWDSLVNICYCGRIQEPQTVDEIVAARLRHRRMLALLTEAATTNKTVFNL